jgi:DNA polymerase elongation subunit (family B)
MVIQSAEGWLLDVSHNHATDDINLLIKLDDGRVISFMQRLKEPIFYILPKSHWAAEDLYQQLSRNDHVIKKIFWDEKYIDLHDRNKPKLIGISVVDVHSQDCQKLIKKLVMDSRVHSLYNTELSAIHQFIYTQLKIAPTSKVRIEYEQEELLSILGIDDKQEIAPPPFKIIHIRIIGSGKTNVIKLNVRLDNQMPITFDELSDESFIFYINENNPDIAIIYNNIQQGRGTLTSLCSTINQYSNQTVVIYARDSIEDISLVELVERARFSYLPLKLASKYGMLRLIDSRITYELLNRDFVIPKRKSVSKYREQIRTLENIVEMDKAGMIISPEIGLHENVAVLDFNDEYANIITGHNISYENLSRDHRSTLEEERISILPSIVEELVAKRVWLKQSLKTQQPESFHYSNCQNSLVVITHGMLKK